MPVMGAYSAAPTQILASDLCATYELALWESNGRFNSEAFRTSLVSGAWAFAPESHSRWQLAQMPRVARVLLQQAH